MSFLLLALTAAFAYFVGSLSTVQIASHLVFHQNLRSRFARDNFGITQFYRHYGKLGFCILLLIELIRSILPVLVGGWLMGILDCAEIGRCFAYFCLLLGTAFPIMYRFKGEVTYFALAFGAIPISYEIAIAIAVILLITYFLTRYPAVSEVVAAVFMYGFSIITLEGSWVHTLLLLCVLLVLVRNAKTLYLIATRKAEKFVYVRDLSYMFDENERFAQKPEKPKKAKKPKKGGKK